MNIDIIIIGAGAAGLMAAITAGQRGRKVLVLDHANKAGKKILMSGGGRCNFTNMYSEPEHFLSTNPHFCKSALARYTPWDFIAMVDKHKVAYHEKTLGQLFCDHSSKDILAMLLAEAEQAGVQIRLNTTIKHVKRTDEGFGLNTSAGYWQCSSVIVASGGLSIPKMGATGFGYELAKQFGLNLQPTRAGLVPFTLSGRPQELWGALSGLAVANVQTNSNAQSFKEAMLFTHRGLSGPAMLQASSYWQTGQPLNVNWLPELQANSWLQEKTAEQPKAELKTVLAQQLPKRFAALLCEQHGNPKMQQLDEPQRQQWCQRLHNWQITPSGTEGYRTAEVTLGGVSTDELSSKTLEAKSVPGLYFVGEVVDVTGHLGGHNFQWAWASGHAAGAVA